VHDPHPRRERDDDEGVDDVDAVLLPIGEVPRAKRGVGLVAPLAHGDAGVHVVGVADEGQPERGHGDDRRRLAHARRRRRRRVGSEVQQALGDEHDEEDRRGPDHVHVLELDRDAAARHARGQKDEVPERKDAGHAQRERVAIHEASQLRVHLVGDARASDVSGGERAAEGRSFWLRGPASQVVRRAREIFVPGTGMRAPALGAGGGLRGCVHHETVKRGKKLQNREWRRARRIRADGLKLAGTRDATARRGGCWAAGYGRGRPFQ